MLTLDTSRNYPANGWDGYADIGDASVIALQSYVPVTSSKNLPTPATVQDYSDGAFISIRGVYFVGILTNFADMPTATLHSVTSSFSNPRLVSFGATGVGYKIRANYLLNRNLFAGITLGKSLAYAFSIYSSSPGMPNFSNASMQVKLKKVDAGGTITTLITYGAFTSITARGSGTFNDLYFAMLTGTPGASILEGDIVYLDTELTFDENTHQGLSFGISQNPKNISFLTVE